MSEEIHRLKENKTWELINLHDGANVIGSSWVFKIKQNFDGSVEWFKERLVA